MNAANHVSSSSGTGKDRRSLVQADITSPGFTGTCTFMGPLSISMAPLSVWYLHPDPGPLTHLTGPPYSLADPA